MQKLTLIAVIAAFGSIAMAQYVPAIPETTGLNTAFRTAPRGYAEYFNPSVMSGVTQPLLITGIQFRLAAGSTTGIVGNAWPPSALNFATFDLKIGKAAPAIVTAGEIPTLTSFNAMFDAGAVVARSGPMTIGANAFTYLPTSNLTNPNPWGFTVNFTTPFTYMPGDHLVYALVHSGYGATPVNAFFAAGDYVPNSRDAVSLVPAAGVPTFDSVAGGFSNPYVVQFTTAPVPEPATIAVLGLGVVALLRTRKAKKA